MDRPIDIYMLCFKQMNTYKMILPNYFNDKIVGRDRFRPHPGILCSHIKGTPEGRPGTVEGRGHHREGLSRYVVG